MKKIFVIIFVTVLVLFSVFNIIKPDVEFSENENRYLAKMPEFSFQSSLPKHSPTFILSRFL